MQHKQDLPSVGIQMTILSFGNASLNSQALTYMQEHGREKTITFLESQGYKWIRDGWGDSTGKYEVKIEIFENGSGFSSELVGLDVYVPHGIEFPNRGVRRTLDIQEIDMSLSELEQKVGAGFVSKDEILNARLLRDIMQSDEIKEKQYLGHEWPGNVKGRDEIVQKYFKNPFNKKQLTKKGVTYL